MSREQFETKLEKDRAKETFVETRLKNLKLRANVNLSKQRGS